MADEALSDQAAWLRFVVNAATLLWSSDSPHDEALVVFWARTYGPQPPVPLASYRTPKGLRVSVYAVGAALLEYPSGRSELRRLPFLGEGVTSFERSTRAWIPEFLGALGRGELPKRR